MICYKVATAGILGGHVKFLCLSKSICAYIWGNSSLSVILGYRSLPSTMEAKEFNFHYPRSLEHGARASPPGSETSHQGLYTLR